MQFKYTFGIAVLLIGIVGCNKPKVVENGVVSINGEWILKNEIASLESAMQNDPANAASALFGTEGSKLKKMIARQLIGQKLLLNEAQAKKIKADSASVEKNIEMIEKRFPDKATFERELVAAGQSRQTLKKQISEGIVLDSLMKLLFVKNDTVPEAEAVKYYEVNKSKFVSPPKFRLSLIMVTLPPKAAQNVISAARKKADEALALCKSGKPFADVAKKFSTGPGAEAGGDIGWFEYGSMNPLFEKAATGLKTGDISDVVVAEPGFIILKRTEEKAADPASYDKVRLQILMSLQMKRRAEIVQKHVDSLITKNKIFYADTNYAPSKEMLSTAKGM